MDRERESLGDLFVCVALTDEAEYLTLAGGEHSVAAVFPDMRGLSARDALRMLARLGMTARLNGAGVVVKQLPEAGAPIDRESGATLWLERQQDSVP